MSDEVILQRVDGVATVILNAPGRRNSLTTTMAAELAAVCDEIDADPTVGAVVIQGAGGYFCSGGDRKTLAAAGAAADNDQFNAMGVIYHSFKRVGELKPPTVAAIRGGAVGAGLNLALATDLRIVSTTARFVSGFMGLGLHPGGGHALLLARAGSREVMNAFALFGEELTGAEFVAAGLGWRAVADDEVEGIAHALAARAGADPDLSRRTAGSVSLEAGPPALGWDAALELERAAQMWSMRRRHLATGDAGAASQS